ncbi:MAG: ECF transporter S component [Clostridia bacterium]|nr:ECF transporter S component [Clostridia bacterium]
MRTQDDPHTPDPVGQTDSHLTEKAAPPPAGAEPAAAPPPDIVKGDPPAPKRRRRFWPSEYRPTRVLAASALLAAVGSALNWVFHAVFFGLSFRPDLSALPVLLAAYLFGPVWSALVYAVTDLAGCLSTGDSINLLILLCKVAAGAIFGLCLFRRKVGWKSAIPLFLVGVLIDFGAMALCLHVSFGMPWAQLLVTRPVTATLNFAIRCLALTVFPPLLTRTDRMLTR